MTLTGVLVVDKPRGMTSFDVVRRVKRAARVKRVGHGGTLDPLATGVLPICLGEATKLLQFLLDADKEYEATLCLGVETDTLDADGAVTARADASGVGEAAVRAALPAFAGRIQQVPPAYSALKRNGRPLYEYARAGESIEVGPREVTVHELALGGWDGPQAIGLRVRCSKGTYIRSLVADLGRALGCGAHLTALRRTRSGPFALAAAIGLDQALAGLESSARGDGAPGLALMQPEEALAHLPRCRVDETVARDLGHGRRVPWGALGAPGGGDAGSPRVCVLRPGGALLAVVEPDGNGGVRIIRGFTETASEAASETASEAVSEAALEAVSDAKDELSTH